LGRALRLLRRRSRQLSRKQKKTVVERDSETGEERQRTVFSRNYEKAALRLARTQRRLRNVRRDFLHKVTTGLAKTKPVIVIEDLNVRGLVRNGRLSRAIADVGWGTFRRMLEYKCRWYGARLIVAPQAFPSTKRCSRCGAVRAGAGLSLPCVRSSDGPGPQCGAESEGIRVGRPGRAPGSPRKALPGVPREVTPVEIPLAAERLLRRAGLRAMGR
jgi:IS605 OrfB family transposase